MVRIWRVENRGWGGETGAFRDTLEADDYDRLEASMENALVELRHYEVELTDDVSSRFGSRFLSRKEAGQELRERLLLLLTSFVGCLLMTAPCQAQWRPHTIQLVNGSENRIVLPARFQVVNETWIPRVSDDQGHFWRREQVALSGLHA